MENVFKVFRVESPPTSDNFRSIFAEDTDNILYSKDFLRLGGKTQIFVEGFDDHLRNRLTHTLEVAQLSNIIANYFTLNLDLTNAIAYGHDIGHTPFGHAGERILNRVMNGCCKIDHIKVDFFKNNKGFKHNWHGIRVLNDLNRSFTGEKGFKVSNYVEWGILNHTEIDYKPCERKIKNEHGTKCGNHADRETFCESSNGFSVEFYKSNYGEVDKIENLTLESLIVRKADEIAQRHHDIEDGIIGRLITLEDILKYLPSEEDGVFEKLLAQEKQIIKDLKSKDKNRTNPILKKMSRLLLSIYLRDLITNSRKKLAKYVETYGLTEEGEFHRQKTKCKDKKGLLELIDFSDDLKSIDEKLRKFLKSSILNSIVAQSMDSKAEYIILKLINAYINHPQYLPKKTISDIYHRLNEVYPRFIKSEEIEDIREFISNKHFTKLHNTHYINFFLRGICDFIAGMTDDFAYKQFNLIYGTEKFSSNNLSE